MSKSNEPSTATDSEPEQSPTVPPELGTDHPLRAILYRRWQRLNIRDEHWMCCVVGEEGSGKSYSALKIAKMVDPSFDETQAFFDPGKLLEVLEEDKYQRGDVFVVDEAGVGLGNRTWHDEAQVATNQALQLIRDHNIAVIFTLPRLSELDSQTKGRLQDVIEMIEKEDGEFVKANWWELDVDRLDFSSGRDGTWMSKPTWQGRPVKNFKLSPPEYDFISSYETRKDEFQTDVYAEARDGGDSSDDENELTPREAAEEIIADDAVGEYIADNHGQKYIDKEAIAFTFGFGEKRAKDCKRAIRELGEVDDDVL